ncbi:MAG: hypothetical protein M0Q21_02745 [Ignavibacteriaceae bacterium]|nr:hypothetical protein [Ignavibacteriaceae bacterium]
MANTLVVNDMLKELIKEGVREVLKEERHQMYQAVIPVVTKKELADIEKRFTSPDNYHAVEFNDMTLWITA